MPGAVFLDRDGTISEEVGYVRELEVFQLLPGAGEAIRLLNQNGLKVLVVSNQSGVARGYFTEAMVQKVNERMVKLLSEQGAHLDGIYYCPHYPEGVVEPYCRSCDCRKPSPGLLNRAAREHSIDLPSSYMVGDKLTDIELASRVRAKGILVLTGYGKGEFKRIFDIPQQRPVYIATNLLDAVNWILSDLSHKHHENPRGKIECYR